MDETGAELTAKPTQSPPDDPLLSPRLTAGQLALLPRYGEVRPTVAGQELFREGDRSYDFIVILSGAVTVLDHQAGAAREATGADLGRPAPGRPAWARRNRDPYLLETNLPGVFAAGDVQRLGQAGSVRRRRGLDRHPLRQRAPRPARRFRRRSLRPLAARPTEIDSRRHS